MYSVMILYPLGRHHRDEMHPCPAVRWFTVSTPQALESVWGAQGCPSGSVCVAAVRLRGPGPPPQLPPLPLGFMDLICLTLWVGVCFKQMFASQSCTEQTHSVSKLFICLLRFSRHLSSESTRHYMAHFTLVAFSTEDGRQGQRGKASWGGRGKEGGGPEGQVVNPPVRRDQLCRELACC